MLDTAEKYGGSRHTKSYPKRKLLPEFDDVEIVSVSHMDMEDEVLNPDPRVCRSVVCLYVHGFESLWEFMIQHLIGET